jgi:hypothetical protein
MLLARVNAGVMLRGFLVAKNFEEIERKKENESNAN